MQLNFTFSPEDPKDVIFMGSIGKALQSYAEAFIGVNGTDETDEKSEETIVEEKPKKAKRTRKVKAQDEPVAEQAADETIEEQSVEETIEEQTVEEPVEEQKVEEPVEEQKVEETVIEEKQAAEEVCNDLPFSVDEPKKKVTKDEWTTINRAKRSELGIAVGQKYADLIQEFNKFVMDTCELVYGVRKPKELDDETRANFVEWFNNIKVNENYKPGSTDEREALPFVSPVLTK